MAAAQGLGVCASPAFRACPPPRRFAALPELSVPFAECPTTGAVWTSAAALGAWLGVSAQSTYQWMASATERRHTDLSDHRRRVRKRDLPHSDTAWAPWCRSSTVSLLAADAAWKYLTRVFDPSRRSHDTPLAPARLAALERVKQQQRRRRAPLLLAPRAAQRFCALGKRAAARALGKEGNTCGEESDDEYKEDGSALGEGDSSDSDSASASDEAVEDAGDPVGAPVDAPLPIPFGELPSASFRGGRVCFFGGGSVATSKFVEWTVPLLFEAGYTVSLRQLVIVPSALLPSAPASTAPVVNRPAVVSKRARAS
jgi:hypothetical protein